MPSQGVNKIIPNSTKKSGRPRKFNVDAALDAAVEVFWQKGFDGASLEDLTDAMGINRPSLYAAFGGKKELYIKALEKYGKDTGSKAMDAFIAETDIRKAVEALLCVSLDCQTRSGDLAKGCMFANCAVASLGSVPEARSLLRMISAQSHSLLAQRFTDEIMSGNLPADFPCDQRADWLLDAIQAQAYRARIGEDGETLRAGIEARVDMILM